MTKFTFLPLLSFLLVLFSCSPRHSFVEVSQNSLSCLSGYGMSIERVARLDSMLENSIANNEVPGLVALVQHQGQVVLHKAYGKSDVQANKSMQKDAIFRIASQSKAITATAVMMLWEEGHFNLDDPISKYIPEFTNPRVFDTFNPIDTTFTTIAAKSEISIRHILAHTSGIGYGVIDVDTAFQQIFHKAGIVDLFTTKNVSIKENALKLAEMPLHHHPAHSWTYSEGLDLIGYFVEVISGMPFDVFLEKRIFEPLGMEDTYFYLSEEKYNRLVPIQMPQGSSWVHYPTTFYDPNYPIKGAKTFFSGGAGLCSTAKDYAAFLQMYLNGGKLNGHRILSRSTVRTIMQNQIGDHWKGSGNHFGLAFAVVNELGLAKGGMGGLGTFTWSGYFNTQYFADPEHQLVGILMKQTRETKENTYPKFLRILGSAIDD